MSDLPRRLRRFAPVVAWAGTLLVAALVAVCVVVPRVAHATPYVVMTSSMRPHLPPGTLVVVRRTPATEVGVGDVITYQLRSGRPEVVTHRVVAQGVDAAGRPVLQTQGDANPSPDPRWVRPEQVRGELWYAVPYVGRVTGLLTGPQRHVAVVVVGAGLLGYALQLWGSAWRDRRRRHTDLVVAHG